jgi:glycosyltransferase involved in cell wall biosynthesis
LAKLLLDGVLSAMNRNAPCSCGSGKRLKHCCGITKSSRSIRAQALAAHRAGALGQAELLYRRALAERPEDIDVLHMLGLVLRERMRYSEALDCISQAAVKTGWAKPSIRRNLGFILANLLCREANKRQEALLAEFIAWEGGRRNARIATPLLVTVVLPAYNHAQYVAEAIASVEAQTYRPIELVIIDDGSTDGTVDVIRKCVADMSIPVRFFARANRGASVTLNEGAALARGQYLSFLNSDDYYAPERVSGLVKEVAESGGRWGFSLVSPFDGTPQSDQAGELTSAERFWQMQSNLLGRQSNSVAFATYNLAISTGNLFIERQLFRELGGFHDYRYNHDWDFCLRAGALAEPIVVARPLYFYRKHERNTIDESRSRIKEEADRVLSEFLGVALSNSSTSKNPLAPHAPNNHRLLLRTAFNAGMGELVPVETLRSLTEEVRATLPSPRQSEMALAPPREEIKTAIVVLGMHRSGTSALARVLNLCGAVLPPNVMPRKLGDNPTGYWEAEEVKGLNDRALRRLGGAWDNVGFSVPETGEFVDEFKQDVRTLLAWEYCDEDNILIKDPRIGALISPWHVALTDAGYRPVYVVLIRNPLEVAQSLRARGDMSVRKGLLLWLTYMQRIADFADTHPAVVHIRFSGLLEDWRETIATISDRLHVRLDWRARAEEISEFLEPALRRQVSRDETLADLLDDSQLVQIRSLYQTFLDRCDRDAGLKHEVVAWPTMNVAS